MKKFIISLTILALLIGIIAFHVKKTQDFGAEAAELSREIEYFVRENKWEKAEGKLSEMHELWNGHRLWATITVRTNVIDDINMLFEQTKTHASLEQKPDFMEDFIRLKKTLENISRQEGLNIEEIL